MTYVFASDPLAPCLGYLSAAPTVSTRADAASAGPRAHILGAISGFKASGWDVVPFIKGDRVAPSLAKGNVQRRLEGSPLLRYAADAARLVMAERSRRTAWAELGGRADWVYERFATMQVLGHRFKRAGVPWVLETQGLFYYETRVERATVGFSALAERIEKHAYQNCDALIAVSPPLKDLIVRECGVDPDKILVVPNAVELERFDPALNATTRHFDELTIGFVGGLIGWQALDQLMEAMAELEAESGLKTALAVVGDGAMREPWEARARALGLGGRVRFLGQVPGNLVKHAIAGFDLGYAGARVMQIGQMYHSPIKLYEYMAQGIPVLAADFPDARGLVEGQGTGYLFEPGDKAMLKAAIRTAHERRADLPAMGLRGRVLIERDHTWTARVRDMLPSLQARLRRRPEAGLVPGLAGA